MEEKKYTVMRADDGKLYIDTGKYVVFPSCWFDVNKPRKHIIIDPENWEVGEVVSVNDFDTAFTGSATYIRRVL